MGRHHTATAVLVVALGAVGASACSAADDDDSAGFDAATATIAPEVGDGEDADAGVATGRAEATSESAGDTAAGAVESGVIAPGQLDTRALAVEAGVRIGTPDIRQAADDTVVAVRRNGATIRTADVNIGTERDDGTVDGRGVFQVSVAPERLDALIDDLDATVGPVTGRTQNTADVTDQLVDLDIRISVERDVIEQFQTLLRDATEFDDVVAIQRVISERTISLEQLLASQRNLENRVAESTLTIELFFAPTPVAEEPTNDGDGIADAFATGWDAFVGAVFAIGFVLAVTAPFVLTLLVVLSVIGFGGRWLIRRDRRRSQSATVPTSAPHDSEAADAAPGGDVTSDEPLAAPTREG